jgi:hypothetical protein
MIVIPLDVNAIWALTGFCAVFEFLRIAIANWWILKNDISSELKAQKIVLQREISKIPPTQLVERSIRERKVISIDKQLDSLKLSADDGGGKMIKYSRILRILVYSAVGIYFSSRDLLLIDVKALPLVHFFTDRLLVSPHLLFLIFVFGFGWRHIFRTMMPLFFRRERDYV